MEVQVPNEYEKLNAQMPKHLKLSKCGCRCTHDTRGCDAPAIVSESKHFMLETTERGFIPSAIFNAD